MRTLTATLLAQVAAKSRKPHLTLTAVRKLAGHALLQWEQLGSGNEAPGPSALTQLSNGTLIRGRLDVPQGRFWVQAIATPSSSSAWSTWPYLVASNVTAIALWSQGTTLYAAWVNTSDEVIFGESSDSGATWTTTTLATATSAPAAVAGATNASGKVLVVWDDGSSLKYETRSSGIWSSTGDGPSLGGACTGLAVHYRGDFNVLVTGSQANGDRHLWTTLFGDGYSFPVGTWYDLDSIALANAGSQITYHDPTLAFADSYRFFYRESFDGNPPGNRAYWSHHQATQDPINNLWREPVPFDFAGAYGPALAYTTGDYIYLASYNTVWRAAWSPTPLDLASYLRAVSLRLGLFGGQATITLGNDGGAYSTLAGELQLGSQLALSLGYTGAAGAESSTYPPLYVRSLDYRSDKPHRADLILTAEDSWWLLSRWTARRSFHFATGEKNVFQLLTFLFARAGLPFTTDGASADLADLAPAFSIYPGDSGSALVQRVLALVPDYCRARATGMVAGAIAAADASLFSWGGTYPILSSHFRRDLRHFNHIQLHGQAVFGEAFDWTEIGQTGSRLQQITDRNVTTSDLASSRATGYVRDETIQQRHDSITVPVHPGLELLDVVDVTDSRAGLSAATRRITDLGVTWEPTQGRFDQTLELGET